MDLTKDNIDVDIRAIRHFLDEALENLDALEKKLVEKE